MSLVVMCDFCNRTRLSDFTFHYDTNKHECLECLQRRHEKETRERMNKIRAAVGLLPVPEKTP